jgi:hypothetical protein
VSRFGLIFVGAITFLGLFMFSALFRPFSGETSASSTRIQWQGGSGYIHGANMPWYNWRLDFGGANSGVNATHASLSPRLAEASNSGIKTIRWWVFPGDAWQIQRDASGPTGLHENIWRDFDKALELAEQHDLYYQFTLFSGPSHIPASWLNDAGQREKLASALAPLFARYANNPRVMTWEVFNEPDWDIWNGKVQRDPTREVVRSIAAAVRANSPAHVTVGAAMLDGLSHWTGLGLTFYQAHWYDYMKAGNWCALCSDFETQRLRYNLDKPLVIGEFYAGSDIDALGRFNALYSKGYAGAFAWSLFSERTNDKMKIDMVAARTFAASNADLWPNGKSVAPPPAAVSTPVASPPPASTATPPPTAIATPGAADDKVTLEQVATNAVGGSVSSSRTATFATAPTTSQLVVLYAFIESATVQVNWPNGFVEAGDFAVGSRRMLVAYGWGTGSSVNYKVSFGTSTVSYVGASAYSGVDRSDPIDKKGTGVFTSYPGNGKVSVAGVGANSNSGRHLIFAAHSHGQLSASAHSSSASEYRGSHIAVFARAVPSGQVPASEVTTGAGVVYHGGSFSLVLKPATVGTPTPTPTPANAPCQVLVPNGSSQWAYDESKGSYTGKLVDGVCQ